MDPPLDPPLRLTFLHPGVTLDIAAAHGNISNYLNARSVRLPELNGTHAAGADGDDVAGGSHAVGTDSITAPLSRLNSSLRETAEREAAAGKTA